MINTVSQQFLDIVKGDGRTFRTKLVIDNQEYTEFRELKLTKSCESGDSLSFGSCFSSSLTATIPQFPKETIVANQKIVFYVGLKIDTSLDSFDDLSAYEWVKLGVFNVSESKFNDDELKLTAYDNFYLCEFPFTSRFNGIQKISNIVIEQCDKFGLTFKNDIEDLSYNVDILRGLTLREALDYLASYLGKNAIFNEDGKLQFVWYNPTNKTISAERFSSPLTVGEYDTVINSITCVTKENVTDENGNIETKDKSITVGSGEGITFSNPYMTEARLNALLNKIKGFTFRTCEMNWIVAEPHIQIGDIVFIEDLKNTYAVPIMSMEMNFNGGCSATVKSKYKAKEVEKFEGSLSKRVERNYQEYASFKQIIVEDIKAFNGEFTKVNTDILNVNKELTAIKANIGDLNVDELTTRVATIETSYVNKQFVNENYVGIQYANQTYAIKSEVNDLTADVAKINTLLSGSVTAGSTQTIVLNAENTTIANALIKNAMIDTLSFDKIIGIDINTTKLNVHSSDGYSTWKDNTILIKDSTRTRVQIGKDAQGDYNIYIWDKNGKVMFDSLGLTADGVNREVIDNSNVKENAGIKGSKLDIDSVITEVNGATTTIKSSMIKFDEANQTLDVAFNSMSNTVNDHTSKIQTNTTNFNIANGKISTLITDVTQAKTDLTNAKGSITTLSNNYSSIKQTVDGLSTTVGSHTSSIANISTTANNALNTANSKAKVFTATPTTPYKVGDLWVQGSSGVIMKCKVARDSGDYVASDWEKADKYTDDATANKVRTDLTASIKTVTDKQATFHTTLNSITSRVSSTETNITTINNNVTSLTTRMSTAEQKITDSAIVSAVTKSSSWTTLNTNATDAQTKVNNLVDLTTIKDTRSANNNPQWYFTNFPKKTVREFKSCTTVGISGEDTYGTLETTTSWEESSGGFPIQLFYPNNSQNIYRRVGTSTTAWGAWTKVAGTHNAISVINQTAEQIKIQASKIALEGLVTANSRFKILTDGSMEAVNGKFSGNISASSITGGTISGATITGATITGGSITSNTTINVNTNLTVGNNIYLGTYTDRNTKKFIYMNDLFYISSRNDVIAMGVNNGELFKGKIYVTSSGSCTINGTYANIITTNSFLIQSSSDVTISGSIVDIYGPLVLRNVAGLYGREINSDTWRVMVTMGDDNAIYLGNWGGVNNTVIRGKTVKLNSTSGATVTSDRNLKKDIYTLDNSSYEKFFMSLKPISYVYDLKDHHRNHVGFIAQEVEDALYKNGLTREQFAGICVDKIGNYKVNADDDDVKVLYKKGIREMYSLRYEEFIALNTHMIQKNITKINDINICLSNHKKQLQELKNENARLKQELRNTQFKLDAFINGNYELKTVIREVV